MEQKVSNVCISGYRALPAWACSGNQQLVTVAVVLLSFLTYAAFRTTHADVASSGRRLEDNESDEGIQLGGISALEKCPLQES